MDSLSPSTSAFDSSYRSDARNGEGLAVDEIMRMKERRLRLLDDYRNEQEESILPLLREADDINKKRKKKSKSQCLAENNTPLRRSERIMIQTLIENGTLDSPVHQPQLEPDPISEPQYEPGFETEPEPTDESETEPEPTDESETEPEPTDESETEPEPTDESETEPELTDESETEPEPTDESETEPVSTDESETEPEPMNEFEQEPAPVDDTEPEPEPMNEFEQEPAPVDDTESESESTDESESESESTDESESESESTDESESESKSTDKTERKFCWIDESEPDFYIFDESQLEESERGSLFTNESGSDSTSTDDSEPEIQPKGRFPTDQPWLRRLLQKLHPPRHKFIVWLGDRYYYDAQMVARRVFAVYLIPLNLPERVPTRRWRRARFDPEDNWYGEKQGFNVGYRWSTRLDCSHDKVHRPSIAGIHPGPEGAYSVALSGAYPEDLDYGNVVVFTGAGGRDLKDVNGRSISMRNAPQVRDQELNKANLSLITSLRTAYPVRLIRGHKLASAYAPDSGYRYDGLYRVVQIWYTRGFSGFHVFRFTMFRLANQSPPPWGTAGQGEIPYVIPELPQWYPTTRQSYLSLPKSTYAVTPSTSAAILSTYALTPSTYAVTPSTYAVTPSTYAVTPSTYAVTPSTYAVTPSTSAGPPSKRAKIKKGSFPRSARVINLDQENEESVNRLRQDLSYESDE